MTVDLQCRALTVEYLERPIGVHTERPRFSWLAPFPQVAFRVVVRASEGIVWDSGRVGSADTALIEYAGDALGSNRAYEWTVTSWDAAGAQASASSSFETALLAPEDRIASWVEPAQDATALERWTLLDWIRGETPTAEVAERLRPVQLLRQRFELTEVPVRARLYATARGVYTAAVNGVRADGQLLAPGFDSYTHRVSVQCYDVTGALRTGRNAIGVALADGWWSGRIGITGSSAQFGDRTAAWWQLHLEFSDGRTRIVGSDSEVRSSPGAWDYADLFVGEQFDARRHRDDWGDPDFDDTAWSPVSTSPIDPRALVPFRGEPITRVAEVPAVSAVRDGASWIVDFGQVVAGRVRLRMRGTVAGQRITIEHTETLTPSGEWFRNIAGINKEQTDVYISVGGDAEFEPEFTFHGFRYVRITGLAELALSDVAAVVISSGLRAGGDFTSSDARLNRLHQNVVWSQRANFLSVPTDCPQRERAGWTGDIQVFAAAATNNATVVPFLSRWLDNLRADQLPDGGVPIISPRSPFDIAAAAEATGIGAIVTAAGWSDAIAFVPWALWERTGDRRVLEENYEAIIRWIEFQRRAAEDLPARLQGAGLDAASLERQRLLYNAGDHFGDWLTPSTLVGKPLHLAIQEAPRLTSEYIAPMFQVQTLTIAGNVASVLGRTAEADEFRHRAEEIRAAFAAEYVDADGDLPVRLQGLYVLALAFDMVPVGLRSRSAARLAELVIANGHRLDTGFLSVPYLLDVLWDNGYPELARRILWQSEQPSWLYEVDHGATTIWESWDAIAPDGAVREVSLNHYAFGCVDDWLYRRVAGIRSLQPGFRSVVIEPDLQCGLTSVDAHLETPHGRISVAWRRTADDVDIELDIPPGVTARVVASGQRLPVLSGRSTFTVRSEPPGTDLATPRSRRYA